MQKTARRDAYRQNGVNTVKSSIASSVIASLWLAASLQCAAQESYPVRPVTIVVPFSAGSQPDILARTLAEGMGKSSSQPVVVLNREGAAGTIAVASVAQARPDGYTLGFGPNGQFSIQTHLLRDLAYKVEQFDFLCERGCDAMQGYFFSNPLPAEEIPRLLQARHSNFNCSR